MSDDQKWQRAVALVQEEWGRLPEARRLEFRDIATHIIKLKQRAQELGEGAGAATACAACGGQCCAAGKFHFTVVDLLVYLATGKPLFLPDFGHAPHCPYSTGSACLMEPGYRPYNCITFICEMIEDGLRFDDKQLFYSLCDRLKGHYSSIEKACGRRFMGGLLQTFDGSRENGILGTSIKE